MLNGLLFSDTTCLNISYWELHMGSVYGMLYIRLLFILDNIAIYHYLSGKMNLLYKKGFCETLSSTWTLIMRHN